MVGEGDAETVGVQFGSEMVPHSGDGVGVGLDVGVGLSVGVNGVKVKVGLGLNVTVGVVQLLQAAWFSPTIEIVKISVGRSLLVSYIIV
jgi:hypothetical protein